jgi:hypothetical protein
MNQHLIKRFTCGTLAGLFVAAIYWSNSAYFQVSFSLAYGIINSLFLVILFGVIATIIDLDKLIDNFPPL